MTAIPVLERLTDPDGDPAMERSRLRFAAGLAAMGVLHFVVPSVFERIVPRWFPWPRQAVLWSGVAELTSGVLIAVPRTTRTGAWLAVATLLSVYPANVQMAFDAIRRGRRPEIAATFLRLPLQVPMVAKAMSLTR
jgi:uncharacterized membrane protein